MIYISTIYDLLHSWLQSLNSVWMFFSTPFDDLTTQVLTQSFFVPEEAAKIIARLLSGVFPAGSSLLTVMLGHLVIWYLGYQLITYIANLVT